MNTTTQARSLVIMDCPGASSEDQDRGSAAAQAVFLSAGLTAEHRHAQTLPEPANGDPIDSLGALTWQVADRTAIAACCAGWYRVPESAHLELG